MPVSTALHQALLAFTEESADHSNVVLGHANLLGNFAIVVASLPATC